MALSYSFRTVWEKRLRAIKSQIAQQEGNPLFDIFLGIIDGFDDLSEDIMDALEGQDPNIAIDLFLDRLATRFGITRGAGESNTDLQARLVAAIPSKQIAGTNEFINFLANLFTGSNATISEPNQQEAFGDFELVDELDFTDLQDQQDNATNCELPDENDFTDLQDQQDNSPILCRIFDERLIDPFLAKIELVAGSYSLPIATNSLLAGKSARDTYQIEQLP